MSAKTVHKVDKARLARMTALSKGKNQVKVGIFGELAKAKDGNGPTVAYIAQVHEFGAPEVGIPERSFMRSTANENKIKISKEQAKLLEAYLSGKVTIRVALAVLGESLVSKIKRKIKSGIEPELAPATKAAKVRDGKPGNTPLIDTGRMLNSIGYEVEL